MCVRGAKIFDFCFWCSTVFAFRFSQKGKFPKTFNLKIWLYKKWENFRFLFKIFDKRNLFSLHPWCVSVCMVCGCLKWNFTLPIGSAIENINRKSPKVFRYKVKRTRPARTLTHVENAVKLWNIAIVIDTAVLVVGVNAPQSMCTERWSPNLRLSQHLFDPQTAVLRRLPPSFMVFNQLAYFVELDWLEDDSDDADEWWWNRFFWREMHKYNFCQFGEPLLDTRKQWMCLVCMCFE